MSLLVEPKISYAFSYLIVKLMDMKVYMNLILLVLLLNKIQAMSMYIPAMS